MALTYTPVCDFNKPAPDFTLKDPEGKVYHLADCSGDNGLLVMFICNHCPYVKAILNDLIKDTAQLMQDGIGCVAIMANDYHQYPEDAPAQMLALSKQLAFPFPYLVDDDQRVAKAYGAVCTPDFFGYNNALQLQYRGRFTANPGAHPQAETNRELLLAMQQIARTGTGPEHQTASMGCSLKWK